MGSAALIPEVHAQTYPQRLWISEKVVSEWQLEHHS